ncbi:Retrotransposon gag protein [Popillia japonica]|uniref:Retrotransposon gag protein n=1 Tax=Popillia japonica TaxID=7064 RepID=A0AAW1JD45_POPJA
MLMRGMKNYNSKTASNANAWDEKLQLCYFANYLKGSAANWFRTFAKRNPEADWNHTVREFKIKFIGPSYQDDLEYSLIGKRQLSNQGIREFFYEIIDLCDEVDPEMSENTIMRRVIAGLLPYYRHMINISRPKSLGDLEEVIDSIAETERTGTTYTAQETPKNNGKAVVQKEPLNVESLTSDIANLVLEKINGNINLQNTQTKNPSSHQNFTI